MLTGKYSWYGNGVNASNRATAGGKMSSGNRCPLARYSNANKMKMNVDTSSTQNASIAIAYEVKNWSSAVSTTETKNHPSAAASGGRTKYFLRQKMNNPSGTAATSR